jgi:tetratricopeptide (TPR) repeat protein
MKNEYKKSFYYFICFFIVFLFSSCSSEKADIERGHRYVDRKNYDRAIQNYSFALKINPSNPDTYYYRGFARVQNEEYDAAIEDFSMAIKLDPNYFGSYINRGTIFKDKGKLDEALKDYNRALKLRPDDIQAILVRADIWFDKKLFDKAISDYNEIIKKNPEISIAYRGRGDAYYHKHNYKKSIEDYQKTIDLNPKDSFTYNNLSWILSTCIDDNFRDGEKALLYSNKAVEIDPSPNNLSTLAAAYAENNRFDEAIDIMKGLVDETKGDSRLNDDFKGYLILFQNRQPIREVAGL